MDKMKLYACKCANNTIFLVSNIIRILLSQKNLNPAPKYLKNGI